MNSAEIQYALDRRGVVDIDAGSTIESPIQLAGLQGIVRVNCPGDLTYVGPEGLWAFEWNWKANYIHTPCHLVFNDLEYTRGTVEHGGILRINPGEKAPSSLTMRNCNIKGNRSHCIDANGVAYIESVYIRDIRSNGGGCIRWIGESPDACGRFKIENWRHFAGGNRVGAQYLFKNLKNVYCNRIIDEGDPSLLEDLKNVYVGPITLNVINCSGLTYIDDIWQEPWGSWDTRAPGCWAHEVRADETSGNYSQHSAVLKNLVAIHSNIEEGVAGWQVTGGDDATNAVSLRVDFVNFFNLWEEYTKFSGKVFPFARGTMSNFSIATNDIQNFTNLNSGAFVDYWKNVYDGLPTRSNDDKIQYTGSDNQANYTSEPAQYDA